MLFNLTELPFVARLPGRAARARGGVKQTPDVIPIGKFAARRWLAALAAAICLSGSAGQGAPPAAIIQESPSATALPDIDHVGVFVDGAVDFADMSGDYIDIADSRIAIAQLAEKTNAELVRIGCTVDFTETPFVGGLLGRAPVPAAANRDAKPAPLAPPFDLGRGIDPDYETALQNVSLAAAAAFDHPALLMDLGAWSPAARDGLAAIAARRPVHYLLVVQDWGISNPGCGRRPKVWRPRRCRRCSASAGLRLRCATCRGSIPM
jgi:hypothetical protein